MTSAGFLDLTRPIAGPNGRHDAPSDTWPRLRVPAERRKWLAAQLAAAVLLLVTLAAIYVTFLHDPNQTALQPVTPLPSTPIPAPTPDTSAGEWSMYLGDAARSNIAGSGPVTRPGELWRVQANGPCDASPVIVDSVVYAACGDGILYALDAATGAERWRFDASQPLTQLAAVTDLVYVADSGGVLYAVNSRTGEERWRAALAVATEPIIDDGLLVVGTTDGALLGLDAASSAERWRIQVDANGRVHDPAIADGAVFAGSVTGGLVAVDAVTGQLRWRVSIETTTSGTARPVDGVVYLSNGYVGSGWLRTFDAISGAVRWSNDVPILGGLTVSGDLGFGGGGDGNVYAIDIATGAVRWQVPISAPVRGCIVAGDLLYVFGGSDRTLYALETTTGRERWRYDLGEGINSGFALADGVIYVGTGFGAVIALGETGGTPAPVGASATPRIPSSPMATIASPVAVAATAS